MHCYVVDSHMHQVPVGVPGELLLSGPRMAKGEAQVACWPMNDAVFTVR